MRPLQLKPRRVAGAGIAPGLAAASVAAALAFPSAGLGAPPPVGIGTLAREMSPSVARCLIQREPALVEAWLRTLPGSSKEARLVSGADARFPACFDRWGQRRPGAIPKYDRPGIRAGLVRALLQSRRDRLPTDPPPASGLPYSAEPGDDPATIVAADLGACLARRHWSGIVAIVRAVDPEIEGIMYSGSRKAGAAREREAARVDSELSRMVPSVAGCVPAGAKLRLERPRLRTLIEEAAWQMISAVASFKDR